MTMQLIGFGAMLGAALMLLGFVLSGVASFKFAAIYRRAGVLFSLRPQDCRRAEELRRGQEWRAASAWSNVAAGSIVAGALLISPSACSVLWDGIQ
jgi:hypothetical protein